MKPLRQPWKPLLCRLRLHKWRFAYFGANQHSRKGFQCIRCDTRRFP